MNTYTPDRWVVVTITPKDTEYPAYQRVLAGWYGGYAGSDSWRMNSGITNVKDLGDRYMFEGHTGSTYECYKGAYGQSMYMASVLANLIEEAADYAEITVDENYANER